MIKKIQAHVLYRRDYGDDRDFSISRFEMPNHGYITVCSKEFEIDVPDEFDPRQQQLEILRKERDRINAEFAIRVKQIDDEINKLIALEYVE